MHYSRPTLEGKIIKRYKRFLADCELEDGSVITAHSANTGSMQSCWEPGWPVLLTHHDDPKRKLKYGLELTHNGETWINVNTANPNKIVKEGIERGDVPELQGFEHIRPEYKVGESRIDLLLYNDDETKCFVEVKNVTLRVEGSTAAFPDAVSTRGQKHLRELTDLVQQGHRACMFYLVSREDVKDFRPAFEIDPEYAELLRQAVEGGVEVLAYQCRIAPEGIFLKQRLPFLLEE